MEKYKITNGKAPLILSFIMLALFGALYLWLKSTNNGAMLFAGIFVLIMAVIFLLVFYRTVFYKVLIYEEGFYYQSTAFNGRYFSFSQVEKAWLSQGIATNGYDSRYLNVSINDEVIRIPYFYNDNKAVKYFIKQAEKFSSGKETFVIDGKFFGKTRIVISIVIFILVSAFEISSIKNFGFHLINAFGFVLAIAIILLTLMTYLCFRVNIGTDVFYLKTSFFDGRFFAYDQISHCEIIKKENRALRRRQRAGITFYFYFCFTDIEGKKHKFLFESPIHQHEIEVLTERIKNQLLKTKS